jgi:hypothetical protein
MGWADRLHICRASSNTLTCRCPERCRKRGLCALSPPWDSSRVTTTAPHLVEPPNGEELAKFLLARLAEDEVAARTAQGDAKSGGWIGKEETSGTITIYSGRSRRIGVLDGLDPKAIVMHLLENAPYYVGVDCRAKRAVVEMWLAARDRGDVGQRETLLPVLLQLAARYHQHEDFQQRSWRLW